MKKEKRDELQVQVKTCAGWATVLRTDRTDEAEYEMSNYHTQYTVEHVRILFPDGHVKHPEPLPNMFM